MLTVKTPRSNKKLLVGLLGFEPRLDGLKVRCATIKHYNPIHDFELLQGEFIKTSNSLGSHSPKTEADNYLKIKQSHIFPPVAIHGEVLSILIRSSLVRLPNSLLNLSQAILFNCQRTKKKRRWIFWPPPLCTL